MEIPTLLDRRSGSTSAWKSSPKWADADMSKMGREKSPKSLIKPKQKGAYQRYQDTHNKALGIKNPNKSLIDDKRKSLGLLADGSEPTELPVEIGDTGESTPLGTSYGASQQAAEAMGVPVEELTNEIIPEVATPEKASDAMRQLTVDVDGAQGNQQMLDAFGPEDENFAEVSEEGFFDKFKDKDFWESIPGVDRVDWMTALAITAMSLSMGNPPGLALGNGLLRGLESKQMMGQQESELTQKGDIAGGKADMEMYKEQGRNQRAADKLAGEDGGGAMSTDDVSQSFGEDTGMFSKYGKGEVEAMAPNISQLQKLHPEFKALPQEGQFLIAKALKAGDKAEAQALYKEFSGG